MAKMTKAQAGKLGGLKTAATYGKEYMREIARLGAIIVRETGEYTGKTINGKYLTKGD